MDSIERTALVFRPVLSQSHPIVQVAPGNPDPTRRGPVCCVDVGGASWDTFLWSAEGLSQIGNGKHNTVGWVGYRGQSPNVEVLLMFTGDVRRRQKVLSRSNLS